MVRRASGPAEVTGGDGAAAAAKLAYREIETELRVESRRLVATDLVVLTLVRPDGSDLPEWSPGAHIDLILPDGMVRQYSLCGGLADRERWRIGILRDAAGRGGSRYVHDELPEGATVRVRGPRNHFPLISSPRYQFVAGGIGITPILTMIEMAEARGAEWRLLYGGRQRSSMGFLDELAPFGDRVSVRPQDEHGMLDLAAALGPVPTDTLVYCCGPEGLLTAVEDNCRHWPAGSLHIERFAAKAPSAESAATGLASFEVVCRRSGVTLSVGPEDTIYDVLAEADIDVLVSCMEGVCGTCEVEVLEGEPDHRDAILSDAPEDNQDVIMVCVSRSRTERLVLDL